MITLFDILTVVSVIIAIPCLIIITISIQELVRRWRSL